MSLKEERAAREGLPSSSLSRGYKYLSEISTSAEGHIEHAAWPILHRTIVSCLFLDILLQCEVVERVPHQKAGRMCWLSS